MFILFPLVSPLNNIFIILLDIFGLFLAFSVYWSNRSDNINKGFSLMVFTILAWVNFYYLAQYSNSTFWFRLSNISVFFFFIAYYFFTIRWFLEKIGWYKHLGLFVLGYGFIFGFLALGTNLIIPGYEVIGVSVTRPIFSSFGWWAFYGFVIVITLIINWALIKEYLKYSSERRTRILYLLIGLLIFAGLNIVFNVILPVFFSVYQYYELGNYSTIFLLGFSAYAIVKKELFGIKVILTQALILSIDVLLLWQTVVAIPNWIEFSWKLVLFLCFITFGRFLIRSVKKEIQQKEKIQELNKELEKAYVVEKKAKEDVSRAYGVEKRANDELEKLDKIKDQFLLTTQHDLRRPLTSIRWFLDMMLNGTLGRQTKKTVEGAEKIRDSVENSIEEVNNFLDVAQFQMGKSGIVLKPGVEILPILEAIIKKLSPMAQEKQIGLKFDLPAPAGAKAGGQAGNASSSPILISADEVKLKAAISNIVDNAIKYTPTGEVIIKLSSKSQETNSKQITNSNDQNPTPIAKSNTQYPTPKILISIKDTGIGIPKEKVGTIFDQMFERTEQAKRITTMGKGIGLYLSGQIIKAHNGKVWAESEGEGKGSTFYVELPIEKGIGENP